MKIIRLSTLLDFGGIESKMSNLSAYTDDNQWIFCALGNGGDASRKIMQNKKEAVCFHAAYKIPSIKSIFRLYLYFKRQKPNVVHCSGSEANFHGVIAAKLARVPVIIAEEIGIPGHSKTAIIFFNLIYQWCDFVAGESKAVIENLKQKYRIDDKKLKIIPNFTLFSELTLLPSENKPDAFMILSVSRLESVKNIKGIIRAIYLLKQQNIKVKYTVVGSGSDEAALQALVEKLDLKNEIEFVGFRENPGQYYLQTDLFVLNSLSEGFSNSLLEAMYYKKPVITTNTGAAQDIINEGINGWIVSIDDENELFQKIKDCINLNQGTRDAIGNNAHKTVIENFSLQNHVAALIQLYTSKK